VGLEEPNDPSDSIDGHGIGIGEIEAVLATGIDDLFGWCSSRFR
jgi:hypothetical protein